MIFGGLKLDLETLKSNGEDGLQSEFNRITNRTDIKIIKITWQSEWRWVICVTGLFNYGIKPSTERTSVWLNISVLGESF